VSEEQAATPLFGPDQAPIPGLETPARKGRRPDRDAPTQPPLMSPVSEDLPTWPLSPYDSASHVSPEAPPSVGPDQLSFDANQISLDEVEPGPEQLLLLPEPPVWEEPATPPQREAVNGRLARRRSRRGITPGQQSLFDE
jgi:hypothetical protein